MGLFGNREKKAAEEAAGAAEVERLNGLGGDQLAAEVMAAFGPEGPRTKDRGGLKAMQVIQWLVRDYPRHPSLRPLADSVPVALQRLAGVGLLKVRSSGIGTGVNSYTITEEGSEALAQGAVAESLGRS